MFFVPAHMDSATLHHEGLTPQPPIVLTHVTSLRDYMASNLYFKHLSETG